MASHNNAKDLNKNQYKQMGKIKITSTKEYAIFFISDM
jgi:hypothetical protein